MSDASFKVVVTRRMPAEIESRLKELFEVKLNVRDNPMTEAQLREAVRTADILIPTVTDDLPADLVEALDARLAAKREAVG